MGAIWGDYDNDGFEDLFVYKWGRPELFHNDAGKRFTRVTDKSGFPDWVNAGCATWLDFDCDGRLDLFLAGYWDDRLDLWHLNTTKMMPESFEYAQNGGRKYLFRNRGDGTFEDVTDADRTSTAAAGRCAAAAADLRGTGYPDLFVANDYGVSELFANQGGKSFREIGKQTGIGFAPKSGMNVAFGDIFNQGRFVRLCDEYLRGGGPDPGQQPVGAQGRHVRRIRSSTKTSPDRWESSWAVGASAPNSAI